MTEETEGVVNTRWIVPVNKYGDEGGELTMEFLPFGFSESLVLLWHGKHRRRNSTKSSGHNSPYSRKKFGQHIIRIPDSLTNFEGKLSWFFFSEKKKMILKKNTHNVSIPNIMKSFQRHQIYQKPYTLRKNIHHNSGAYDTKESKIVAVVIKEKRSMDGVSLTSLRYFSKEQLLHHLRYNLTNNDDPSDNYLVLKHIPYVSKSSKNVYFDKLYYVKWTPRSLVIETKIVKSPEIFELEQCYEPTPAHVKAQVNRITDCLTHYVRYLTDELLRPRVVNFTCKEDMYGNVWFLWMNKLVSSCVEVKAPIRRIHYEMKISYAVPSKVQSNLQSTSVPVHVVTGGGNVTGPNLRNISSRRSHMRSSRGSRRGRRRKSSNKMDLLPFKWTCPCCVSSKTDYLDCELVSYGTIIKKYELEEGLITIPPVIQLTEQKLTEFRYNRIRDHFPFLNRQAQVCRACASVYQRFELKNDLRKTKIYKKKQKENGGGRDEEHNNNNNNTDTDYSLLLEGSPSSQGTSPERILEEVEEEGETEQKEEEKENTPKKRKKRRIGSGKNKRPVLSRRSQRRRKLVQKISGKNENEIDFDKPPIYVSPSSRRRNKKRRMRMRRRRKQGRREDMEIISLEKGKKIELENQLQFEQNHIDGLFYRNAMKKKNMKKKRAKKKAKKKQTNHEVDKKDLGEENNNAIVKKNFRFSRLNDNKLQRFNYVSPASKHRYGDPASVKRRFLPYFIDSSQPHHQLQQQQSIIPLDLVRCIHSNSEVLSPQSSPAQTTKIRKPGRRKTMTPSLMMNGNNYSNRPYTMATSNVSGGRSNYQFRRRPNTNSKYRTRRLQFGKGRRKNSKVRVIKNVGR